MPYVETTKLATTEEQVAAVGTYTWKGGAHVFGRCLIYQLRGSEGECRGVERLAIDVVFHFAETLDHLGFVWQRVVVVLEMSRAIVECAAIGCPAGEALEFVVECTDVAHFVVLHIVEDEVALAVLHLDLCPTLGVERLSGVVGGVCDEREGGVPRGIDTSRNGGVGLEVYLGGGVVVDNHGSAMPLTHVELHVMSVEVLIGVAVDTLSVGLARDDKVVEDVALVEVGEVALVDAQHLVCHIGWIYESVRHIGVDVLFGNAYVELLP